LHQIKIAVTFKLDDRSPFAPRNASAVTAFAGRAYADHERTKC